MSMQGVERPCLAELDDGHFAPAGLCQCGCADCTTRLGLCTCLDCTCDSQDDHANWIWDDTGARRGGTS